MSMIRKVPFSCSWNHKRYFGLKMGENDIISRWPKPSAFVYDSYLQNSIKESERAHTSGIAVNLKPFWS